MGIVNSILNYIFFYKREEREREREREEKNEYEYKYENNYPDNFFCPICLNTLNRNNKISIGKFYIKFDCNHYIHFKCLRDYIFFKKENINCPICRANFSISKETFESNIDFFKFYYKILYYKEDNI